MLRRQNLPERVRFAGGSAAVPSCDVAIVSLLRLGTGRAARSWSAGGSGGVADERVVPFLERGPVRYTTRLIAVHCQRRLSRSTCGPSRCDSGVGLAQRQREADSRIYKSVGLTAEMRAHESKTRPGLALACAPQYKPTSCCGSSRATN